MKGHPRIPPPADDIQVNFCKTPTCKNFGVAAAQPPAGRVNALDDTYVLKGLGDGGRVLLCRLCDRTSMLRSNVAIAEEVSRLDARRHRLAMATCRTMGCSSFGLSVAAFPALYGKHGKTHSGEARLRCKSCGSTLTAGPSIRKSRLPQLDPQVLKLVVNKVPMRRICEVLQVNPATLYGKIARLAEIAAELSAAHEHRIADGEIQVSRAYVSVDRQDHLLNWGSQLDRRYTALGAVGAVENESGYVLTTQLNFDPALDPEDVEADAITRGDYQLPTVYRHYARVWLRQDYGTDEAAGEGDGASRGFKAPRSGMQVRIESLHYGAMEHLKRLLRHVPRVRIFVDRDPGLDSAAVAAFCEAVRERRCDVWVVKTSKTLSVDRKKLRIAQVASDLQRFARQHDLPKDSSVRFEYVLARLREHRKRNPQGWFAYPLPDMADPDKELLYVTDYGDLETEHLARLYMRASLRGVDKFFMQVRRRLSILERPLVTRNNVGRGWHGYAAYSPLVVQQVLQIFRAYYNLSLPGNDGRTPAMRLGLLNQPLSVEDFSSASPRGMR